MNATTELEPDEDWVLVLDGTAMLRQRSIEGEANPQSLGESRDNPSPGDEWPVYSAY